MKTTNNYSNGILNIFYSQGEGGGHGHQHRHGAGHSDTTDVASEKFLCPMKCEGNKTYDKPGNCPVCNMKLVQAGNTSNAHG